MNGFRGRETGKEKAKSKAARSEKPNSEGSATRFDSLSHPPKVLEETSEAAPFEKRNPKGCATPIQ